MIKRFWIALFATVPVTGCLLQPPPVMTGVPSTPPSVTVTNTLLSESHSASTRTVTPTPVPIATSTRVLFPSVTVAGIEARITPAPLVPLSDVSFPGRIYGWVSPFDGYLDPNQPIPETRQQIPGTLKVLGAGDKDSPGLALALSFSKYTGQIAYLLAAPDGETGLWISDLQFNSPIQVWVDMPLSGEYVSTEPQVSLKWGVRDKYVFIETHPTVSSETREEHRLFVYSIPSQQIAEIKGSCNELAFSLHTGAYALACSTKEGHFIVLEQDGEIWDTEYLPEGTYVQDFSFSPKGDRVAYVDAENAVYIVEKGKTPLKLPVRYPEYWYSVTALQWSHDASKILVFGSDMPGDTPHCVLDSFNGRVHPCWQLFNTLTGERLWWLGQIVNLDAALSPDGHWLVANYIDERVYPLGTGRKLMIYDTTQLNVGKVLWLWNLDAIHWGD